MRYETAAKPWAEEGQRLLGQVGVVQLHGSDVHNLCLPGWLLNNDVSITLNGRPLLVHNDSLKMIVDIDDLVPKSFKMNYP